MGKLVLVKNVQISVAIHTALTAMAGKLAAERGKKPKLREMVEEAVLARWPDLATMEGVVSEPASEEDAGEVFGRLLQAVFTPSPDVNNPNANIDALGGSVAGSFGQKVRLKDLAYHLRGSAAPIGTLVELIQDFERVGK